MRKFWLVVFVIALIIVGYETFKYQQPFATSGAATDVVFAVGNSS